MFCLSVKKLILLFFLPSALPSTPYLGRSKKEKEKTLSCSHELKKKKKHLQGNLNEEKYDL